jgi:hypothetical protein
MHPSTGGAMTVVLVARETLEAESCRGHRHAQLNWSTGISVPTHPAALAVSKPLESGTRFAELSTS